MNQKKKRMNSQQIHSRSKIKYLIGIDPGVNTGICVYSKVEKKILELSTVKIHQAMDIVKRWTDQMCHPAFIRIEDARKRKWFGNAGREQLQGAGSIKRDCKMWEDYLTDTGVEFELVAPKNNKTKLNAESFKRITGYPGQTNEHSRDACMLVFGL